ncbi:hypothetical protein Tco_1206563, partial [Tanacetum coccineum]
SKDVRTPALSPSVPTVGSVVEHDMKRKRNVQNDMFKDFPAPPPRYPLRVPTIGSFAKFEGKGKKLMEVTKVIVISSDDDLSTNEQITLIGDVPFSNTDDDSDDDDSDDDDTNDESYEEQNVKKQQSGSTSRGYRKIAMTGCVLFLRARDAPTTSFGTPIKTQVKVTNCVLALKAVNAPAINVASSSKHRRSG